MDSIEIRETVKGMAVGEEGGVAHLSISWREGSSGRVIAFDIDKKRAGKTAMKVTCLSSLPSTLTPRRTAMEVASLEPWVNVAL